MIRLNDNDRTVIDEKLIKGYGAGTDNFGEKPREEINFVFQFGGINVQYDSKEARDKDIELLDKLFDVKSIEYEVKGREKPKLACEPIKEEYLTWKDVKRYATSIKTKLPNGETRMIHYDDDNERIQFDSLYGDEFDGNIYDEDLFNALMLKKVE